jgi:hypothetical protein
MTDVPIACRLTSAELRARRTQTAELAGRALRARRPTAHGEVLEFSPEPGAEAALAGVVAAEAECCPFLSLELRRTGESLELTITGPPDARPIVAALFA